MDSVTQFALGAAIGEASLGRQKGSKAALAGGLIATIPDLDVLLSPFFDTFTKMNVHRGFSHSILFSIIAALLVGYLLSRMKFFHDVRVWKLIGFSFLCLFTHGLLDAFTTYGTQLFSPFSNLRVGFDSVNVVDPIYTLSLVIGTILSITLFKNSSKKRRYANILGLIISTSYLLFTLANKRNVELQVDKQLEEIAVNADQILSVPIGIGNLNWRTIVTSGDTLYLGEYSYYKELPSLVKIPRQSNLLDGLDQHLVDRLIWFAKGNYAVAEYQGRIRFYNLQVDTQGPREVDGYIAPTAFYYEIKALKDGSYTLESNMHSRE
ncbi:metal-dependent hydrolase [Portibacter lacus]|uniref:Membrane protein n=1 Tax=Portibacter lacus TaxID=1099794 RepID=A0AA37WD04_9BACT|nr:metal-dependent hydrolase [Portibacter lacus]GLR17336.1 membrane protein [Portibacter lacus]